MNISTYLILVTLVGFLSSSCVHATGMNEESKAKILNSLKAYKPEAKLQGEISAQQSDAIKQYCERENYSISKKCIEMKYMNGDLYKVRISFRNQHEATEELPINFANDSVSNMGSKLDAYLRRWSVPVLTEFIGEDYEKYDSVKLVSLNRRYVNVLIEVMKAEELEDLFKDSRIVTIHHVGVPERLLEEIAP